METKPAPPTPTPDMGQEPYRSNDLALEDLTPEEPPSQASAVTFGDDVLANVARRNAEATEALKASSMGLARGESMLKRHGTKRINAKLISAPQPLSSSASVDAVVIPAASMSQSSLKDITAPAEKQSSKLSLRIKKLREKLKSKSGPNGEEVTPWTYDARSPTPGSSVHATGPATPSTGHDNPAPAPAAPPSDIRSFRFPSPVPSPTKETSGLKNMLHRLRSNSKREPSGSEHSNTGSGPSTSVLDISLASGRDTADAQETPRSYRSSLPPVQTRGDLPPQIIDLTSPREGEGQDLHFDLSTPPPATSSADDAALSQLFAAADNLGLDKAALTALLARSTSASSKSTAWTPITRSNSVTSPAPTVVQGSGGRDSTSKYLTTEGLKRNASTRAANALSRVPEQPAATLRPPNANGTNASTQVIVRRTLIFPSESEVGIQRKPSLAKQNKKRRASTQSVASARSVQDRVPTPPPNRASRRLSKDQSPPMPPLSPALAEKARMSLRHSTMGFGHRAKGSASSNYGSL